MKKIPLLFSIFFVLLSCGPDKSTPEYVAKQYLIALKNNDWEKAKKYSSKQMKQQLEMMEALNTSYGITEIKNIKCEDRGSNTVACTFCCSLDSGFTIIFLEKTKEGWQVLSPKGMIL